MIKAVFFDSGRVLVQEDYVSCIAEYEEKLGIKKGKLYESVHDRLYWTDFTLGKITEENYFNQLANDFVGSLDIEKLKEVIYDNFILNTELADYLITLKDRFTLGIISNNPKEWFDYCSKIFDWQDIFDVKAVSGYLHIRKPDIRIFQQALEIAKINGNEAIYVDDRPDRVDGAKALGMKIIIYSNVEKFKIDLHNIINNK
ncbi:MAG: HAD family phosphatase [Patescibacteria group bacterium]|nr:HAD family phosphatase [Patescibacteria group bacterium]